MTGRRCATAVVAAGLLGLLGGCGSDTDDSTSGDGDAAAASPTAAAGDETAGAEEAELADGPADGGAPAVVTVDGQTYPSNPALGFEGGSCKVNDDPARPGGAFVAYFAATGERVQLSFLSPSSDDSSADDVFRGSLGIGADLAWSVESLDPWPWTGSASSAISASLTMEDKDGNPAEVTIDITCP
jgi:hypothetical protein